jgi:branched chain amino acid efflux pump
MSPDDRSLVSASGTVEPAGAAPVEPAGAGESMDLRASRRQLVIDGIGIFASVAAFGVVFGLAARAASYSLIEAIAMSTIMFAGAAQFAAVGLVAVATPWPAIMLLTALLNARHLLYSAALAPWLRPVSMPRRALMAHVLTDEAFALSLSHFQRLRRLDTTGYWIAGIGATFIPWNLATIAGYLGGQFVSTPQQYGLDVVFPAAMAGLAVGLVTGRREIVAVAASIAVGVLVALAGYARIAVVAAGVVGPLVGLLVPVREADPVMRREPDQDIEGAP